jgi:hypothetical protein
MPEKTQCSHPDCDKALPLGTKIPEGWTHALVEVYGLNSVSYYHVYLCPLHVLASEEKQQTLFQDAPP